jgi:hypothetical protein
VSDTEKNGIADAPLARRLAELAGGEPTAERLLDAFLGYVAELGLDLYPAQEEAILALLDWKHVILDTPTGSGKSLVALALHFQALAEGRVSFYTAPTKALVNEKFFALCDAFGPERVGLLTGDGAVNRDAPVVCCTQEVLANMALRSDEAPAGCVVMDEFHYYGDRERGTAWQIPLIAMKDSMFLLMSATLGDTADIAGRLRRFTEREATVVKGRVRPVPLDFEYRETPLHETIESLLAADQAPIYLVSFTQRECPEQAQNLMSVNVLTKEEKQAIAAELEGERFPTPYGKEFQRFVRHGLGVHHAGLLPRYRRIVERLAQKGLIKVISGTDTLGVGVNIPIRTAVIRQLYKFDGEKTVILPAREFHQISGRAGRKGFDDRGTVVVQAPEWVIENLRLDRKVAANPNLKKKLVKKRPPPRSLPWDRAVFDRLCAAEPEALAPRFEVTHGMLIHLLQSRDPRPGGGYRRLVELIGRSHLDDRERRQRLRRAAALLRSLRQAGIVSVEHRADRPGSTMRVRVDLQDDFSLNQALSLYLVQTIELLEPASETWHLDVLSLVEAILEDPKAVIYRQVDKLKGELVAQLKAEGVEYEERMERLQQVRPPQPNEEFIRETFAAFALAHPWVGEEGLRPKSIAREMYERCLGFNDYVNELGLSRSEGVLLRYLSQCYKAAVQTIPSTLWTEELDDVLSFLHGLARRTDASLLEEWELLVDGPLERGPEGAAQPDRPPSVADDPRALRARIRAEIHALLGALSRRDFEDAAGLVAPDPDDPWTPERFAAALEPYFAVHAAIDVTPKARLPHNTVIREMEHRLWEVHQKIIDPQGDEDFGLELVVDLRVPKDESGPLIALRRIGI